MKQIQLKKSADIMRLITDYNLTSYHFVNIQIGSDDKIYLLFNDHIPERINGMFVNTQSNSNYCVVVIEIDWNTGEVKQTSCCNLGQQVFNYHIVQPFKDGILLVGTRCRYLSSGPEQNAAWFDLEGHKKAEGCLGDGIADCIVTQNNDVIVSYFDEGIFGNYGWDDPIGSSGLVVFDENFKIKWEASDDISDCYAINIDEAGHLWYYYYDEFDLVKTDFKNTTHYKMNIEGANSFLVSDDSIVLNGGYDNPDEFYLAKIDALSDLEKVQFVYENEEIEVGIARFLQSKMLFIDINEENLQLYIADEI